MQIAIIGLGLIGGSLAKALKENTEHTVIGFDRDENTLLDALSLGAIDSVGSTSLLENADVVYVCLYPADVVRFVEENAPHFKEGCIVTDVCGIKNQVCGKLTEIAKNYPFVYVGGHPMAGKEQNGFAAHYQASKPVHLGTCVVQRRNTQEYIILCLSVMYILDLCRMHQALMVVQDSLWESCCSR